MYEHEDRERKNDGEIKHIAMPPARRQFQPAMYAYLDDRELDYELAIANGWYATESRGPRIVIPCVNSYKFNYWQARSMGDHAIRYDSPAIPRRDSIVLLWPKKHKAGGTVIITEGPCDALAAAEFYPAIAVMGGCPSDEVLDFIEQKTSELGLFRWVIIPDNDNAEFVVKFLAREKGVTVLLPSGKDLAGMPRWEREKLLGGLCLKQEME